MKEASFYLRKEDQLVECLLCPKKCLIQEGKIGFCNARQNIDGKLYSLVYGNISSLHIDPIEKKPLFHFFPGSTAFSFGTLGCNLRCKYCQNWDISQSKPGEISTQEISPKEMVRLAIDNGCQSIASTYNEPTIFFEYMLDVMKESKKKGLNTVMVSNGFISQEPLKELLAYSDAFNIDIKGFTSKFYGFLCGAWLNPIMETVKTINNSKSWLEITNLVIPTMNDSKEEIKKLCEWISHNLGNDVPLHFSAFYPNYQLLNLPPTSEETLIYSYKIAKKVGLNYVYLGNINIRNLENTYCPECKGLLIERYRFEILQNNIKKGKCTICKARINGVFQ